MDNQPLERTAKTVEEAIELALLELDVDRDEVVVDVVSQGRTGILGIGSEMAKVRVSLITEAGEGASKALGVVNRLLDAMDVDVLATIRNSGTGPEDPTVIDIQGEDAGLIIGRRGETLRALQYVANIVIGRQEDSAGPIIVDVEQYRERRQAQVQTLAKRMAESAIASGQPVELEPMSAVDRRSVHVALTDDAGVTTESAGEDSQRRVIITPTGERGPRPSSGGDRRRRSGGGGGGGAQRPIMRDDRD
ncbi:MAG: protein jag [Chloroflexi bacterium]|nr:protein jag [Chloroflexota bacterium]